MSQAVQRVQCHSDKFKIVREPAGEGRIFTKLVCLQSFRRGEIIVKLDNIQYVNEKKWTTIQVGKNLHIELNDELVLFENLFSFIENQNIKIDLK